MPQPYDLITMGRIGVDLYPLQTGVPLAQVDTFGKFLGGSATNVAVAAARLGRRTAVITRTGQDPFGDYLHQALRGVRRRRPLGDPGRRLPDPGHLLRDLPAGRLPALLLPAAQGARPGDPRARAGPGRRSARPGSSGSPAPACARSPAVRPRSPRSTTAPRPAPPSSTSTGGRCSGATRTRPGPYYAEALRHATVAVGNLDECEIATGVREPHAAARALLDAGVELAVVKQGPKGVLAVHRDGTQAEVPPVPVEVVNGLGAGDAFGGALCHGLLAGWELERIMRYANAAGAIVASRLACSSAMPYAAEVDASSQRRRPPARPADRRHEPSTRPHGGRRRDRVGIADLVGDPHPAPRGRRRGRRPPAPGGPLHRRQRPADDRRRRPPGPRRPRRRRPPPRHGQPRSTCWNGSAWRCPAPASTGSSPPPTSSTTCCCSAPSTTRSSWAR